MQKNLIPKFQKLLEFRRLGIFSNVLEYQNGSKFAGGLLRPTLLSELKKNLGVRKSRKFLIFEITVRLYFFIQK